MIHSVGTYLKQTIAADLQAFLSDSYILNEGILGDFPKDVRDDFVKTYCTDHKNAGKPIRVSFAFSAVQDNPYGTILIQQKGGKEIVNQDQALGMFMGSTDFTDTNYHKEQSYMHYDSNRHLGYLQMSHRISHVESISRYTYPYFINGNRIYFRSTLIAQQAEMNDNPTEETVVTYYSPSKAKHKKHSKYRMEGYDATEEYTIDLITSNPSTTRCLAALMKAVFIAMRLQTLQENSKYYLPKISEAGVDLLRINSAKNSTNYNQFYYKRFTLNYIVTYTLPEAVGYYITKIASVPRLKFGAKRNKLRLHRREKHAET